MCLADDLMLAEDLSDREMAAAMDASVDDLEMASKAESEAEMVGAVTAVEEPAAEPAAWQAQAAEEAAAA